MCKRFEGGGARRKLRLAAYSLLAVLLSIPLGLHAQQYSGSITGTVTDSTGAAIPGGHRNGHECGHRRKSHAKVRRRWRIHIRAVAGRNV